MRIRHFAFLGLICLLSGCFWGNGSEKTVKGGYRLEQFEDGLAYYLHKFGHNDSSQGGSIIGDAVIRLGWSNRYILAQRHSFYGGDPDGWMIIDIDSGKIFGPFTEEQLQAHPERRGIVLYPVAEAWKRL